MPSPDKLCALFLLLIDDWTTFNIPPRYAVSLSFLTQRRISRTNERTDEDGEGKNIIKRIKTLKERKDWGLRLTDTFGVEGKDDR